MSGHHQDTVPLAAGGQALVILHSAGAVVLVVDPGPAYGMQPRVDAMALSPEAADKLAAHLIVQSTLARIALAELQSGHSGLPS